MNVLVYPEIRPTPARLVSALRQLSPAPMVLPRLQKLLRDPNSGLFDVVELVKLDGALTARVIHMSNSAMFGRGGVCSTLDEAVNRVGFNEVHRLVATAAASAVVVQSLSAYGLDDKDMWRESISCAFAAELLARRVGEDPAEAYTIGLLHAIGRVAVNNHALASVGAPKLASTGFPDESSAVEYSWLGFTQADAGACMLKNWEFGITAVEVLRAQYIPLQAPEPLLKMSAVIHCARMLRTIVCETREEAPPVRMAEGITQMAGLEEAEMIELIPELRESLLRARQLTSSR